MNRARRRQLQHEAEANFAYYSGLVEDIFMDEIFGRAPVDVIHPHVHTCHLCHEPFECSRPQCAIEDRRAVCFKPVCIAEWESWEAREEQ